MIKKKPAQNVIQNLYNMSGGLCYVFLHSVIHTQQQKCVNDSIDMYMPGSIGIRCQCWIVLSFVDLAIWINGMRVYSHFVFVVDSIRSFC